MAVQTIKHAHLCKSSPDDFANVLSPLRDVRVMVVQVGRKWQELRLEILWNRKTVFMRRLNEQCSEYIHGCRRQKEDHNYLRGERLKEEKTLANTKQDRKPAKKEFLERFSQRMFCPNANLWLFQEEMEAKMRELGGCFPVMMPLGFVTLPLNFIRFCLQGSWPVNKALSGWNLESLCNCMHCGLQSKHLL